MSKKIGLIKVEAPKMCMTCRLSLMGKEFNECPFIGKICYESGSRHPDCPIFEIPEGGLELMVDRLELEVENIQDEISANISWKEERPEFTYRADMEINTLRSELLIAQQTCDALKGLLNDND